MSFIFFHVISNEKENGSQKKRAKNTFGMNLKFVHNCSTEFFRQFYFKIHDEKFHLSYHFDLIEFEISITSGKYFHRQQIGMIYRLQIDFYRYHEEFLEIR